MPAIELDRTLRVKEIRDVMDLPVSNGLLYKEIRRGAIPSFRVGNAICVKLRSVREYVARNSSSVEVEVGRS